ncbi:site-specific integrase [Bradyrhizobium sp. 144]|nr:site-specific integrase [Bradyrhizobium sp. 144]
MGNNFDHTSQFFIQNSIAENSRRAYLSDLREFEKAGFSIPATPEAVAQYLAQSASSLRVATLVRRLASLSKAHEARGLPNPTQSPIVRATMRGIKRTYGCAQRQAKPLCRDDLLQVLDATGSSKKDLRDRALLLLAFAGALRRSELVALNVEDLEHARQGVILHLRSSKTDQEGDGQKIGIPHGRGRWCPVAALHDWLQASAIDKGPIFRPLDRAGRVGKARLSGDAVSLIVRHRIETAGLDPSGYSGHSLRAGLATSASRVGVPTYKIRAQTRHVSDAMLSRYIRDGALFTANAAGALL